MNYIQSADWERGNYYRSGAATASLERLLIGPPSSCSVPVLETTVVIDPEATAQFAAGWLYGVSQHTIDHRDYVLSCFTNSDELNSFVYSAMEDYTAGDVDTGNAKMTCSKAYFMNAMDSCDEVIPDFLIAENYFSEFRDQDDADSIRQANYEKN